MSFTLFMSKMTTVKFFKFTALIKKEDVKDLIKPKINIIKIYDEEYPTINLYNLSRYFKTIIDNNGNFDIKLDYDTKDIKNYLEYICYNTELEIEEEELLQFTKYCDYIQMNHIIFDQIYKFIYDKYVDDLDIIIPILFNHITKEQKVKLYKKYNNFKYFKDVNYNDMKLLLNDNCSISKEDVCEFNTRKDLSIEQKNDILMNYINSVNFNTYELYENSNYYYLKSTVNDNNFPDYDNKIIYFFYLQGGSESIYSNYSDTRRSNIDYKNNNDFEEDIKKYKIVKKISKKKYKECIRNMIEHLKGTMISEIINILQKCIKQQKIEITDD